MLSKLRSLDVHTRTEGRKDKQIEVHQVKNALFVFENA